MKRVGLWAMGIGKEKEMHSWRWNGILAVATLVLALSGIAWAAVVVDGCSNATLTGDYGFTIVGQSLNADGTTSVINGVARVAGICVLIPSTA